MVNNSKVSKFLRSRIRGKGETDLEPDVISVLKSILPAIKIVIETMPQFKEWVEKWKKAKPKDKDPYLPLVLLAQGIQIELERVRRNNIRNAITTAALIKRDLTEQDIMNRILEARDIAAKVEKILSEFYK